MSKSLSGETIIYKDMQFTHAKGKHKGITFKAFKGEGDNIGGHDNSKGKSFFRGNHTTKLFKLEVFKVDGKYYLTRNKLIESLTQINSSFNNYKAINEMPYTILISPTGRQIYVINESQFDSLVFALLKSGFNCYNIRNIKNEIYNIKIGISKTRTLKTNVAIKERKENNE